MNQLQISYFQGLRTHMDGRLSVKMKKMKRNYERINNFRRAIYELKSVMKAYERRSITLKF